MHFSFSFLPLTQQRYKFTWLQEITDFCSHTAALPSDLDDQGSGAYDWRINDMFKKFEPTDQCKTMPVPNDEELDASPIHAEWKEEQQGLVHGNQLWDPGGQPQAAGGNLDEKCV